MRFLDLFAGIGGFRLGMEQASHHCIGFCEIDKFARRSYKAIHDTLVMSCISTSLLVSWIAL